MTKRKLMSVLLVIGILVIAFYFLSKQETETPMLSVRMYDKSGHLITPASVFSIVQGTPGVATIDITATLLNTGEVDLENCHITSATSGTSSALSNAFSGIGPFNLAQGGSNSWTSAQFGVAEFEDDPQPVSFQVAVRCEYDYSGTNYIDRIGGLGLTIESEAAPSADYTVSVTHTGTGGIGGDNVAFRTSRLDYGAGSGIAYSSGCGDELTPYGLQGILVSAYSGTCLDHSSHSTWVYIMDVPGEISSYFTKGANPARLFHGGINPGETMPRTVYVCDDNGLQYEAKIYYYQDDDRYNVDTSPNSITSSMEVAC